MGQGEHNRSTGVEHLDRNPTGESGGYATGDVGNRHNRIAFAGETFQFPVLVASSLTADAILGMDILDANKCTLEMANQVLRFPNRECLSACKTHHRNPTSYKPHWKKPTVSRPSISEK